MPLTVPKYLCLVGTLLYFLLIAKNLWTHSPFPGEPALNTICEAVCVCLLSISIFFGLYGFYLSPIVKREFLAYCFLGSVMLSILFFSDYIMYVMFNRMLDKAESQIHASAISLPKLVDGTRRGETFQKRARHAHMAYLIYGVSLPIRQDDDTWSYYVPTPRDQEDFRSLISINASMVHLRNLSHGMLAGAVNVVLYTSITFIFGLLWLAVKRPTS